MIGDDIGRQNIDDAAYGTQDDAVGDEKLVKFVAQIAVVFFLVVGFDLECKNYAEYPCGCHFWVVVDACLKLQMRLMDSLYIVLCLRVLQ